MKMLVRFAVYCDDFVVVLVCETVIGTKNGRIVGLFFSTILGIPGTNICTKLAEKPQTRSLYDSNFDRITEAIVSRVQC